MVAQEEQWRGRLERVVQAVETWQRLLADGLHNVEPGSALAGDDDRSQGALPSSFAWHGIATAVDHLGMLVDLLGGSTVRLRVFAPFTVARTALIGGSQAVWLLAPPTRNERLERAAMVEADEHKHYATYLRDYRRDPFVRGQVTPALVAEMDQLLATVGSRRSRAEEVTRKQFDMTQMLREATEHGSETSRGADDGWFRRALAHEWRLSSAAAHARLWPLNVRPTERTPAGGDLHHRSLESSPEEFTQAIGAAVLMTNGALDLWDTRRRKHH